MKYIFTISFSLCCFFTKAQTNLVPNPSFEDTLNCSTNFGQVGAAFPWFNATNCTPDYYSDYSSCGFPSLSNPVGYQLPATGVAYSGIYLWAGSTREYISVKLDSVLQSGKKYKVNFSVSPANDFMYATDKISAYLSVDTFGFFGGACTQLSLLPQINNSLGIIADTLNWTVVTGNFIATGGEVFLTIGNFNSNSNTNTSIINSGGIGGAYYYIDDVSIVRCDTCSLNNFSELFLNGSTAFPNPFTTGTEIQFPSIYGQISFISLFDCTGKEIEIKCSIGEEKDKTIINIFRNDLPIGFYFIKIYTATNCLTQKLFAN